MLIGLSEYFVRIKALSDCIDESVWVVIDITSGFGSFEESVAVVCACCTGGRHHKPELKTSYHARHAAPTTPPKTTFLYPILQRILSA